MAARHHLERFLKAPYAPPGTRPEILSCTPRLKSGASRRRLQSAVGGGFGDISYPWYSTPLRAITSLYQAPLCLTVRRCVG